MEAFARSLVVEQLAALSRRSKVDLYESVKGDSAVDLVVRYLTLRKLGMPRAVFGEATWRSFAQAVNKYRNVLLHECTYLNWAKLEELNRAARSVVEKLAEVSGHKARLDKLVAEAKRTFATD